jgi:hypothetical protein
VIASAMARKREPMPTPSGGRPAYAFCKRCYRRVLTAHRGTVTAVDECDIEKVEPNGDVVGRCECGGTAVWERGVSRNR